MQLSDIELGNVVPGAVRLAADITGVNETFIGHLDLQGRQIKAYIKVLNGKQLVNELVATTLGRYIGLPIPKGYLLRARPEDLPDSNILKAFGQEALVFGSASMEHPSLARRFTLNTNDAWEWLKDNCKILSEAIVFDELVANTDRHQGNLLVGKKGAVWLIDHSHCFTGPNWVIPDLVGSNSYNNILATQYVATMTLPKRMELIDKAKATFGIIEKLKMDLTLTSARAHIVTPAGEIGALKAFLDARTKNIIEMISTRVGMPGLNGVQKP